MEISKLEAARRQLVTAIRLFFEDADSVSVYSLGHSAWEVLDALCKHQGKIRFRGLAAEANGLSENAIRKISNFGKNFFKHADFDPEATLTDFDDSLIDHVLIAATMDFSTLASSKPLEIQLYPIWYFAAHPEKIALPDFKEIQEAANEMFPSLHTLGRAHQKQAGLRALVNALQDQELTSHASTDRSPVGAITARSIRL